MPSYSAERTAALAPLRTYEGRYQDNQHLTARQTGTLPLITLVQLKGKKGERHDYHRKGDQPYFGNYPLERWKEFVQDVKENGIREPILIVVEWVGNTPKGFVYEGNHRIQAARQAEIYDGIPVEVRYFGQAEDYYQWPRRHTAEVNTMRNGLSPNILWELYLSELGKYPTFEKAAAAYREGRRGLYWHITSNPDFSIDPKLGPHDMSSMSAGRSMQRGQLMVTTDVEDWMDYYDDRDYVAQIDLSDVDARDYSNVTRGFGSEFMVFNPSKAVVLGVWSKEQAAAAQEMFQDTIIAHSREELLDHWNQTQLKTGSVREAGTAEIELEHLFQKLLPGTKFEDKVFAVGGYVRDQLQKKEPADLDMVVEMPYGAQRLGGFLLDEFPDSLSEPEPLTYDFPIWNMHFTEDVTYAGELYRVSGAEIDLTDTQTLLRLGDELETQYGPISEDVLRRDYTVNMLYKNLTSGEILDPTGTGQTDIERGVLRARPDEDVVRAFEQQPKRMLRLVRFMAQYNWEPDPEIEQAIHKAVGSLAEISGHSLQKEFNKWKKRGILDAALQFARDYGMLAPLRKAWQTFKAEEAEEIG